METTKGSFFSFSDFTETEVVIFPISGLLGTADSNACDIVQDISVYLCLCKWPTFACRPVLCFILWVHLSFDFVFSIAALTNKRSLVLMPESSAEEITVCPGKYTMTLLNFWYYLSAFSFLLNFLAVQTILRSVMCDLCVYVFIASVYTHTCSHTCFLVYTGSDCQPYFVLEE